MALSWPVVLAVLAAALLHAGWNAWVKSSGDPRLDMALVNCMGALLALPVLFWTGLPQPQSWPFVAVSSVLHLGYYIALSGAYANGEFGLTYPIMRGLAPLLVALGSASIVGEVPSAATWLGVLGVATGVALVGLAHPGEALHHRKALLFAFANAGIIACYTLVDGLGVRAAQDALRYVLVLVVIDGLLYPPVVWWHLRATERRAAISYARQRWPLASLGALASVTSYGIALWAVTHAPVASVAALRETSVLFAALMGTWLLRERFGWQRAAGTVVIVAGVIALRLG